MSEESPCPLNRDSDNMAARHNPKNAAAAHCFALHDTVRTLYAVAHTEDPKSWESILNVLQSQLDSAKQVQLP